MRDRQRCGRIFPRHSPSVIALRPEFVSEFIAAHNLSAEPEGEPFSRYRRVVVAQDGVPVMVASKSGDGTVIYLAFEPTARNIRGWSGNEALWRYLITHAAVDNGGGSALVRPYLRWGARPPHMRARASATCNSRSWRTNCWLGDSPGSGRSVPVS